MSNCIKSKKEKCPLKDNCFGLVNDSEDCKCRLEDYQQGTTDGIDKFANMLKAFIDDNGMEEDGEQFAIFTKHYIDLFSKGLKEQRNEL